MKIRAIRLREVGCFAKPTVIEGLTGGLDVLAQPNEAGKSTLFRALRACLFEKHSAQCRELKDLRPYRGGAPLIEVDFEAAGGAFRLRKQFLSGASAELREIGSGAVLARGADAHDRALELIGVSAGKDPSGLFWVAQGESIGPLEPSEADGRELGEVVEREVKTVTGGRRARAAIEEAKRQREMLVSAAQGRPRGAYADALGRVETLAAEVEKARSERDAVEALLPRLEALRGVRRGLRDADRQADLKETVRQAEAALDRAQSAQQRSQAADREFKLATAEREAAARSLWEYDERLARLASLEGEIAKCVDLVEAKRNAAAEARAEAEAAEQRLRDARERVANAEDQVRRIGESERSAARLAERAELLLKLERAEAIVRTLREAESILARNAATPAAVAKIEGQARDVEVLRARVAAGAPSVSIAYLPGGEGRARTQSGPLVAGRALQVTESLEIALESIGTLTVRPSKDARDRDDLGRLCGAEQALSQALADIGISDVESVYRLKAERETAERARKLAAERLSILAPAGLDDLRQRLQSLPEQRPESAPALPSRSEAETSLGEARRAAMKAELELRKLNEDASAAYVRAASESTKLRLLEERHQTETSPLPPTGERPENRAELEKALMACDDTAARRRDEADLARMSLGDVADLGPFEQRLKRAKEAERNAAEELSRREREIALMEGELKGAFSTGAGERLEALEGQLELGRARVAGFAREVAELDLLISVLSQSAAEAKEAFFRPVVERLKPMLQLVLPMADMEFGEGFRPDRLIRGSQPEDLWRLSGGTREQIAVLVRLAFAHLMADGNKPAPVILDDALVYAGDERLHPLFEILHMAARRHQVIVLTCRSRAFQPLGGNRVTLETREFA